MDNNIKTFNDKFVAQMTNRDYMATQILQGIISNMDYGEMCIGAVNHVKNAVLLADELIKQLQEPKP